MTSWLGKSQINHFDDVYFFFLPLNYAYVLVNTTTSYLGIYSVSDDCFKCPFKRQQLEDEYNLYTHKPTKFQVDTGKQYTWRILKNGIREYIEPDDQSYLIDMLCEMKPSLGGYGLYTLNVGSCTLQTKVQPPNVYLPLLLFCLLLLSFIITFGLIKLFLRRRNNEAKCNDGLNLTTSRDNLDVMPSLHFLRGILLILMIFVTTGGGGYPIFSKNLGGLTLAEGLFFIFTFTIGLHVPTMFNEEVRNAKSRCSIFGIILARSIFLCILELAISQAVPRSRFVAVPIWAPLSRIAFTYLVSGSVYMLCVRRYGSQVKNAVLKSSINVTSLLWSWVLAAFLLALMIFSIQALYYLKCTVVFGANLQRDTCQARVFGEVFSKNMIGTNRDEPLYIESFYVFTKGLLGIVSSILMALVGLKAGDVLIQDDDHFGKMKQWCFLATALGVVGVLTVAVLSSGTQFNHWPISTIFLFSSLALFIHTVTYYFTDVRKLSSSIITSCGVASIATLSGHLLFSQSFPFYWGMYLDNHFSYLCQSTWIVVLWVVLTVSWMRWRISFVTRMVSNEETRRAVLSW